MLPIEAFDAFAGDGKDRWPCRVVGIVHGGAEAPRFVVLKEGQDGGEIYPLLVGSVTRRRQSIQSSTSAGPSS
ncbi:hypothetical protein [Labrys monachus]|uniref:Transthyretin n=1 Tax=Labrys monachus TaxID=217067 RepID=A0ABU0FFK7_9HYPH|nr:hypothetical protein [Labrys monachus]MDQ0393122.1 hypothetical protein [Labrys monachus]